MLAYGLSIMSIEGKDGSHVRFGRIHQGRMSRQQKLSGYEGLPVGTHCVDCGNCSNVCMHGVLGRCTDASGFKHVEILHPDQCKKCGKCLDVCPMISCENGNRQPTVYAGWHRDVDVVRASTSGGVFSAMAQRMFKLGGLVAGVELERLNGRYVLASNMSELAALRGSKYVPSSISDVYTAIDEALRSGRPVLCVGLPCQIAALKLFFSSSKNSAKLTTADLICSGMPAPKILELECTHTGMVVTSFRNKSGHSWKTSHALCGMDSATGREIRVCLNKSPFYSGFSDRLLLRKACHDCPYARLPRVGDVTLGDFWGLSRFRERQADGVSLVFANNDAGVSYLADCGKYMELYESSLAEAAPGNPRIYCGKAAYLEHPLRKMMDFACKYFPWSAIKLLYGGTYRRIFLGKLPFEVLYPGFLRKDVRKTYKEGLASILLGDKNAVPAVPAIGILTFHMASNFGAVLQTYALLMTLSKCNPGAFVEVLDYRPKWMDRKVSRLKLRKHAQRSEFVDFVRRYLVCTKIASSDLMTCINALRGKGPKSVVVGSDQVWNPAITRDSWLDYFLGFENDQCRRISYSASFGETSLNCSAEKSAQIGMCLGKYARLSVREKSGIGIASKLGRADAVQTLDPTLAADSNIYEILLQEAHEAPCGLLGVFLDEMPLHTKMLHGLSTASGLKVRVISGKYRPFSSLDRPYTTSVPDYLMSIKTARMVLTDSYHALVFSLIFRRPFVVVPSGKNARRFERIRDLLEMTGLAERVVNDFSAEKCMSLYAKTIDYDAVHARIADMRRSSQEFLRLESVK